jgi:hypothetical protein
LAQGSRHPRILSCSAALRSKNGQVRARD